MASGDVGWLGLRQRPSPRLRELHVCLPLVSGPVRTLGSRGNEWQEYCKRGLIQNKCNVRTLRRTDEFNQSVNRSINQFYILLLAVSWESINNLA